MAGYTRTPGNRAALTAFAGTDPEKAVFYPEDDRYLIDRDLTVDHYEVETAVGLGASMPPRDAG
ncbi:MAG TPA: hypothetical protein VFA45_07890 [Actinomycetes bacterium]|jgi:hypothetical protein|nr:hypothetical protein [Actinomycetes bacterium]